MPADLGVLILNTGSPDAPTPGAVRKYLAQFLSDRYVIDYPRWLLLPVLHAFILPVRSKRSARLYQRIWTAAGSPLLATTEQLARGLQSTLARQCSTPVHVRAGMRYGEPALRVRLHELRDLGIQRLLVLPLFPQYSRTTSGTILHAVVSELNAMPWQPELITIREYYDHPAYIAAIAEQIRPRMDEESPVKLLYSFHSIPRSYVNAGDPYEEQCQVTAKRIAGRLGIQEDDWMMAYQSRFGPKEWLQPDTDEVLKSLGQRGCAALHVTCPGFAVDCLETLYEIDNEGRRVYEDNGGRGFTYIPALNDSPLHIAALAEIITSTLD
ncbi:MAG: ferrochelatase [Anaerolineales bacterium]|nr:ferrochelatase [Anaerolineales bacterium]